LIDDYIAMSGSPYTLKPVSYIEQGTKLVCQCGYEWIENRFPEYAVCPRCDRRREEVERDSSRRRNLVQSSSASASTKPSTNKQIDELLDLLNFGTIDPMVLLE
jgi:hypothetical protein